MAFFKLATVAVQKTLIVLSASTDHGTALRPNTATDHSQSGHLCSSLVWGQHHFLHREPSSPDSSPKCFHLDLVFLEDWSLVPETIVALRLMGTVQFLEKHSIHPKSLVINSVLILAFPRLQTIFQMNFDQVTKKKKRRI